MNTKIKFIDELIKNEDTKHDDYFKVVFSSKVIINDQIIEFKFTEEEGAGADLVATKNGAEIEGDESIGEFEYVLLIALFMRSHIDYDSINKGDEIDLSYDYEEGDEDIEFNSVDVIKGGKVK